jgi:hypothetical protein
LQASPALRPHFCATTTRRRSTSTELGCRKLGDGEVQVRFVAISENPCGRQTGECQGPLKQARAVEAGRVSHDGHLSRKAAGGQRHLIVRITKNIDEIKGSFAQQAFGIDGKPPLRSEVEDVAVVDIAVKNDDVPRFGEERWRAVAAACSRIPPCRAAPGSSAANHSGNGTSDDGSGRILGA